MDTAGIAAVSMGDDNTAVLSDGEKCSDHERSWCPLLLIVAGGKRAVETAAPSHPTGIPDQFRTAGRMSACLPVHDAPQRLRTEAREGILRSRVLILYVICCC